MEIPFNIDAERAVLGMAMLKEKRAFEAAQRLKPEDFYYTKHQFIFAAITQLLEENNAPEMVSVADRIEKMKKAWKGMVDYLSELMVNAPITPKIGNLVNIILEDSKKRRLINSCTAAIQEVRGGEKSVDDIMSGLENDIFALNASEKDSVKTLSEAYKAAYVEVAEAAQSQKEDKLPGLKIGFPRIEKMLAGLRPGQSVVIGARPSVGKSAFATNIAEYVQRRGKKVLYFSLEMIAEELAKRVMAANTSVPLQKLRIGDIGANDIKKIAADMSTIGENLFISDRFGINTMQMMATAQEIRRKYGLDLIVIDYLQLIQWAPGMKEERLAIDDITRKIKLMTRELEVPVISLSQISRNAGGDPNADAKPPTLSQLRGSGGIEQNADTVILLHRENKMESEAKAIIAKQRNGPLGIVDLYFDHDHVKFTEEDSMHEYQGETPFDSIDGIV